MPRQEPQLSSSLSDRPRRGRNFSDNAKRGRGSPGASDSLVGEGGRNHRFCYYTTGLRLCERLRADYSPSLFLSAEREPCAVCFFMPWWFCFVVWFACVYERELLSGLNFDAHFFFF